MPPPGQAGWWAGWRKSPPVAAQSCPHPDKPGGGRARPTEPRASASRIPRRCLRRDAPHLLNFLLSPTYFLRPPTTVGGRPLYSLLSTLYLLRPPTPVGGRRYMHRDEGGSGRPIHASRGLLDRRRCSCSASRRFNSPRQKWKDDSFNSLVRQNSRTVSPLAFCSRTIRRQYTSRRLSRPLPLAMLALLLAWPNHRRHTSWPPDVLGRTRTSFLPQHGAWIEPTA